MNPFGTLKQVSRRFQFQTHFRASWFCPPYQVASLLRIFFHPFQHFFRFQKSVFIHFLLVLIDCAACASCASCACARWTHCRQELIYVFRAKLTTSPHSIPNQATWGMYLEATWSVPLGECRSGKLHAAHAFHDFHQSFLCPKPKSPKSDSLSNSELDTLDSWRVLRLTKIPKCSATKATIRNVSLCFIHAISFLSFSQIHSLFRYIQSYAKGSRDLAHWNWGVGCGRLWSERALQQLGNHQESRVLQKCKNAVTRWELVTISDMSKKNVSEL